MRIKVILAVLVLALAVLAPAAWYRYGSGSPVPPQTSEPPASAATQTAAPSVARAESFRGQSAGLNSPHEKSTATPSDPGLHDDVERRTVELNQLAFSGEPQALKIILAELTNQDAAIRKAALRATIDFGSQDAIPALKNVMYWADDPQEKVDLQKAIDFLLLPKFQPHSQAVAETAPPS
jgi:hypothetical protein